MALGERHKERLKREDRRAGEVVAMLFNTNRGENVNALDWTDIFPEWKEPEEIAPQTEEQMFETMLLFTKQREGLSH